MKETTFIEQNKEKWKRFEQLTDSDAKNPDELSSLYMDITDDLAYAQTFYHRRTVRVYLNQLAQKVYTNLHIQKGESLKKFITVWRISLPLEIYRARKNLLFALVVFLIWAGVGVFSTANNPDFARTVLSDGYIEMTEDNIAKGKPLDVYTIKNGAFESNTTMFIDITTNNLRVAFWCYIFGIFFTIGTHILLYNNAVMVGTFQYFFATKGLLLTSFLGIWIHGAFEISAIVIAAGAGITLGNGLLFPKNYTRMQALQISAKRSLKIMLSLVPFIIMAGFLESYVTANYQSLPEWSKWFLILFCFAIILFVYVIYPTIVALKHPELVNDEEVVNEVSNKTFNLDKIRNLGELIADSFRFYLVHFNRFARLNIAFLLPFIFLSIYIQSWNHQDEMNMIGYYDWAKNLEIMMGFAYSNVTDWIINFMWSFIFAGMFCNLAFTFNIKDSNFSWKDAVMFFIKRIGTTWVGILILFYILSLPFWMWYFLIIFLLPFVILLPTTSSWMTRGFAKNYGAGWKYGARSYGNSILMIGVFGLVIFLFSQPIAFIGSNHTQKEINELPDLLDMLVSFISHIGDSMNMETVFLGNIVRQIVYAAFLILVLPLWLISTYFLVSNELEKEEANGLKKAFELFGKRSKMKETEADYEH